MGNNSRNRLVWYLAACFYTFLTGYQKTGTCTLTISVDPGELQQNVASHQVLHCLGR